MNDLTNRIEYFIILKHNNYLSAAMVISLIDCLSSTYGVKNSVVMDLWNEVYSKVDFTTSDVYFDVERL